jgi:hypothetical protein
VRRGCDPLGVCDAAGVLDDLGACLVEGVVELPGCFIPKTIDVPFFANGWLGSK